jgi:hypothetical protein
MLAQPAVVAVREASLVKREASESGTRDVSRFTLDASHFTLHASRMSNTPLAAFFSILLGVCLNLGGCEMALNAMNRQLAEDVGELLARHGAKIDRPACHMIGATRAGACTMTLTPEQVEHVIAGLTLEASGEDRPTPSTACASILASTPRDQIRAFMTTGDRPPELRLSRGMAFDELWLVQNRQTGRVCIQATYAYSSPA